jgi:hypothetical protein
MPGEPHRAASPRRSMVAAAILAWYGLFLVLSFCLIYGIVRAVAGIHWTPKLRTFAVAWGVVYVGSSVLMRIGVATQEWMLLPTAPEKARRRRGERGGTAVDASTPRSRRTQCDKDAAKPDLFRFVDEVGRRDLLRAVDLGGRCIVIGLVWSVIYYLLDNSIVSVHPAAVSLEKLRKYLDYALFVGPIIGILFWAAELEYKEGANKSVREWKAGQLDVVQTERSARIFGGSAGLLGGVVATCIIAGLFALLVPQSARSTHAHTGPRLTRRVSSDGSRANPIPRPRPGFVS